MNHDQIVKLAEYLKPRHPWFYYNDGPGLGKYVHMEDLIQTLEGFYENQTPVRPTP